MSKIIEIKQRNPKLLHLTWMINNICPNRCSYCPDNLHSGTNHNYEWENAKRFFTMLFQKYPEIHCSVAGGEPSVSPFFKDIVKIFHDAGHSIGVTSNASKSASYWGEISNYLSYICFSYHPEFPDKNFAEKVKAASPNTFVTVRIMMHPRHWDHCVKVFEDMKQLDNICVEAVRVLDWGDPTIDKSVFIYNEEQMEFFNNITDHRPIIKINRNIHQADCLAESYTLDTGEIILNPNAVDYINSGMTHFIGYECDIGLKSLFINYWGDIRLANCSVGGSIGHINEPENIKWPDAPVTCNVFRCHCASDVDISKRKLL